MAIAVAVNTRPSNRRSMSGTMITYKAVRKALFEALVYRPTVCKHSQRRETRLQRRWPPRRSFSPQAMARHQEPCPDQQGAEEESKAQKRQRRYLLQRRLGRGKRRTPNEGG